VKHRRRENIVLWYNGTRLISQGTNMFVDKSRISVDNSSALHIKRATTDDTSIYLCKVLPEQLKLHVHLHVTGPHKRAQITANEVDITNKSIHFNPRRPGPEFKNQGLELICTPQGGNPPGIVQWTHNSHTIKDQKLVIKEVTRKNAGLYQCLADNKLGKPVHASVTLFVQHKPEFTKDEDHVNTGIGYNAELHCVFESNPPPNRVHWYREQGDRVQEDERIKISNSFDKHGRSRTSLKIDSVTQKDLVKYICEVDNELGKSRATVILDMHPGIPRLHEHTYKDGVLKTVWSVTSIQPLTEFDVSWIGSDGWHYEPALVNENSSPHNNHWKLTSEIKIPPGTYRITAKAKNSEGWSVLPSPHREIQLTENDQVISAGIGDGSGSTSIFKVSMTSLLLLLPALLMI